MKDFLKKLIADKNAKLATIRSKVDASTSVEEVRSLTAEAEAVQTELREAQKQLADIEAAEKREIPADAKLVNGSVVESVKQPAARADENKFESMEYRTAFMAYVQNGTPGLQPALR